jgi:hypothetical protein
MRYRAFPLGRQGLTVSWWRSTSRSILFALLKGPSFATSYRFNCFHILGLLDFITGVLS